MPPNKSKLPWVILGMVILVLVVGLAYYFTQHSPSDATTNSTASTTKPVVTTTTWTASGLAVAGQFADADTVKLADNRYRMYYSIQPEVSGNKFEVYSATSNDGKTWAQETGTRKIQATFPDIVKLANGTFRMYFQSAGLIKSALSTDGLTFTDEAGTRIDKTNDLSLTFDNVAAPTVFMQADGTYVMVYRGTINTPYIGEPVPNKNTQILLWATSTDGLNWVKKGMAVDSRTSLYGLADGPELFTWKDDTFQLSFWTYTGVYWSTFDGSTFTTPKKVFALTESTPQNKFPAKTAGDPVYAQFNSVWYMYFGQHDGIEYAIAK